MRSKSDILRLPATLAGELGIPRSQPRNKGVRSATYRPTTRKEGRKAERNGKKVLRTAGPPAKKRRVAEFDDSESDSGKITNCVRRTRITDYRLEAFSATESQPRSSWLPHAPAPEVDLRGNWEDGSLSSALEADETGPAVHGNDEVSEALHGGHQRSSSALKAKLMEDDAEIAYLEKKLGIKSRKLPHSFAEDGLADILSGLDAGTGDIAEDMELVSRREGLDWLKAKRARGSKDLSRTNSSQGQQSAKVIASRDDVAISAESSSRYDDSFDGGATQSIDGDSDFEGFESETSFTVVTRNRENPYVAPASSGHTLPIYVPPSLRNDGASGSQTLVRLRRQVQGLVNRLTEANLLSMLAGVESLYRENPRQHVTAILVELLLTSITKPNSLPDTLIILPAGFIAAIYKVVGTDFGAQVIEKVVELFDAHYGHILTTMAAARDDHHTTGSKEPANLITLLSELYNFQIISSNLVFDYIRLFLNQPSELTTELLLRIIRMSGPQLRHDDPSSLKDIVAMLRPAVVKLGEENVSVRTKFMIETIKDLKNNKVKAGSTASAIVSEHTVRMKKLIGSLNTRAIRGSEPLRIGLQDVRNSDKQGKWWLVGASWAGHKSLIEVGKPDNDDAAVPLAQQKEVAIDAESIDFSALAKTHRMNTDIRRAIFVTIMSSTDCAECHLKLLKLGLKKSQELEIPKVLIYCAGAEHMYNPYYFLVAKKLCNERKLRTAFQFGLWDLFRRMGEDQAGDEVVSSEDVSDTIELRQLVNHAKLFGHLLASRSLSLQILKKLNLSYLQERTKTFLEIMFVSIMSAVGKDKVALEALVDQIRGNDDLTHGLLYFMKKVVRKTEFIDGKQELSLVKWSCGVLTSALEGMVAEA